MKFLCIYLDEGKGGGVALYILEHSQPLLQKRLMDVYETWYG